MKKRRPAAPAAPAREPSRRRISNKHLTSPRGEEVPQQLCIATDLKAQSDVPYVDGSSFLNLKQGDDSTTYESYPAGRILRERVRGDSDVVVGPRHGDTVSEYCMPVSDRQVKALNTIATDEPHTWTQLDNSASWASDTFERITGTDVDADDEWHFGVETARELSNNIEAMNAKKDPTMKREKPATLGTQLNRFAKDLILPLK